MLVQSKTRERVASIIDKDLRDNTTQLTPFYQWLRGVILPFNSERELTIINTVLLDMCLEFLCTTYRLTKTL